MCKKVKALWKDRFPSFRSSSSRWGLFASLFALSAFIIAIGGSAHMSAMSWVGVGFGIVAFTLAAYWLITGSKDTSATKEDIDNLGNEIKSEIRGMKKSIDDLVNEIRQDREHRNSTKK